MGAIRLRDGQVIFGASGSKYVITANDRSESTTVRVVATAIR